ncbi:MAG TPA: BON domain-containing protein [Blastocatellia bacterium]|nr:BON domain-containing protein [Blastocatellia bacterium]
MNRITLILILGLLALVAVAGVAWQWRLNVPDSAREVIGGVTDATITGQVKTAFAISKRISAYEINVDTKDGVVTLKGQVPSEIDKQLAGDIARDTTGVSQVDNQLRVEPGLKPSDASARENSRVADLEIHADLRERMAASKHFTGSEIQVSVKDRVVTLTGRTQTPMQKTGAEQLARSLPNVVNVVNQLTVTNPGAAQVEASGVSEQVSRDKELANQVSFALFIERDNFINVGAIKAESRNGDVTLSGTVSSRAERALAERVARSVNGVGSVSNRLAVSS